MNTVDKYKTYLVDPITGVPVTSLPATTPSDTLYAGTKALTTTAGALAAAQAIREVLIQ